MEGENGQRGREREKERESPRSSVCCSIPQMSKTSAGTWHSLDFNPASPIWEVGVSNMKQQPQKLLSKVSNIFEQVFQNFYSPGFFSCSLFLLPQRYNSHKVILNNFRPSHTNLSLFCVNIMEFQSVLFPYRSIVFYFLGHCLYDWLLLLEHAWFVALQESVIPKGTKISRCGQIKLLSYFIIKQ